MKKLKSILSVIIVILCVLVVIGSFSYYAVDLSLREGKVSSSQDFKKDYLEKFQSLDFYKKFTVNQLCEFGEIIYWQKINDHTIKYLVKDKKNEYFIFLQGIVRGKYRKFLKLGKIGYCGDDQACLSPVYVNNIIDFNYEFLDKLGVINDRLFVVLKESLSKVGVTSSEANEVKKELRQKNIQNKVIDSFNSIEVPE